MIKDPESTYQPGRRGLGWLKLKRALATLDCVVVGVEWGHGKRRGVLSDLAAVERLYEAQASGRILLATGAGGETERITATGSAEEGAEQDGRA